MLNWKFSPRKFSKAWRSILTPEKNWNGFFDAILLKQLDYELKISLIVDSAFGLLKRVVQYSNKFIHGIVLYYIQVTKD